ncbi:MAG: recombinase family protein [Oscillospiraceae bacterium]|nr:recombinase family protein [Oscillospiraceae bacterium]
MNSTTSNHFPTANFSLRRYTSTTSLSLAYAYYRLSQEEAQDGQSSASIINQKKIVEAYCAQRGIVLLDSFVDDGWSGSNFERPGFQKMMKALQAGKANMVITKDLSRLGRDMREASYYAEQFFPEHQIHYVAIADNFDSELENIMAPFQFAMNEVYLRDGSRKVKDVLRMKRSKGEYCACPPFGYKKDPRNRDRLIPDEETAPIVAQIFQRSAAGDSCIKIAQDLTAAGVITPLKYRVLYRDNFSDTGAARATDCWNYTTVKRIVKNQVYLGNTLLGKTRKASIKSRKKISIPQEDWAITSNTHEPLVDQMTFDRAQANLGKGSRDYRQYDHVRKSIFGGIAVCSRCGYSLCSSGTVYKGEREKYWFLSCNHKSKRFENPCEGVNIKYADLLEVVRQDLNSLIKLSDKEISKLVNQVLEEINDESAKKVREAKIEKAKARLNVINRTIGKLYTDNAEGKLADSRLEVMVADLEKEASGLEKALEVLCAPPPDDDIRSNYKRFFDLAKQYSTVEVLDRDTLLTFVEKIEVGPKLLPDGYVKAPRKNAAYQQSVKIYYKFIGCLHLEPLQNFPQNRVISEQSEAI